MDYLADLIRERRQLSFFPGLFPHLERLADLEISRVRALVFQSEAPSSPPALPPPEGAVIVAQEKVYVPVKDFPNYNFVGRILGPRGMTAKQLEQETGCKIMVRGRGSLRDRQRHRDGAHVDGGHFTHALQEDNNRGRANWEHLEDELHVLIQCEDTPNRAQIKMKNAIEKVKKLLVPAPDGTDELKRKQLMELAIINGTYRPPHDKLSSTSVAPSRLSSSASTTGTPQKTSARACTSLPGFSSPMSSPIGSFYQTVTPPTPPSSGFPTFDDAFDFNFNFVLK
ncbi:alternative splicing defective protein 2 [Aphelenchoides avenae]|nr:alternative splicing defective protein 2 [Aphelenchus avenae]